MTILIAAPAAAQPMPTTNPQMLRQMRIQELEDESANLPKIPATRPSDIVSFAVEDSRLVVTAPLAGKAQDARIMSNDLGGVIKLTTFPIPGPGWSVDQNFILVREDLTHASIGDISMIISSAAGRILVSRDTESDTLLSSVQFIQDPPGLPPSAQPQDPVRLLINVEDLAQQQTVLKAQVGGRDFIDLRRRHGSVVDRFVRPIFRELKQESIVFAVPSEVAWQVLGFSNVQSDPQLEARLKSIIDALGADDFHQRQAAADQLRAIGKPAAARLAVMDRSRLSAEQNAAIESFLADALPLSADEVKHWANDKNFLLDILFSDDQALRDKAMKRLSELQGRKIELQFQFDSVARVEAVTKLRNELNADDNSIAK